MLVKVEKLSYSVNRTCLLLLEPKFGSLGLAFVANGLLSTSCHEPQNPRVPWQWEVWEGSSTCHNPRTTQWGQMPTYVRTLKRLSIKKVTRHGGVNSHTSFDKTKNENDKSIEHSLWDKLRVRKFSSFLLWSPSHTRSLARWRESGGLRLACRSDNDSVLAGLSWLSILSHAPRIFLKSFFLDSSGSYPLPKTNTQPGRSEWRVTAKKCFGWNPILFSWYCVKNAPKIVFWWV